MTSAAQGSAAAPGKKQGQAPARLAPGEIKYLALEGGGGKGFAYLGALQILEEQGVLGALQGVAGTSAGAITAMMLALRMGHEEIAKELDTKDFNTFFDPPLDSDGRRLIPAPFDYVVRKDNTSEQVGAILRNGPNDLKQAVLDALNSSDSITALLKVPLAVEHVLTQEVLDRLAGMAEENDLFPLAVLARNLDRYMAYFGRDMGLFSGKAARDYFDMLTRREAVRASKSTRYAKGPSLTFREHKLIFKMDLLVCGANLSTGRSVLFSWKHTPDFPVADAVRISMGLPIIYKPYVLAAKLDGWPECGTYIDGGLWNNLPFREIGALGKAANASGEKKASAVAPPKAVSNGPRAVSALVSERNTLGLRLAIEPPTPVLTGGQLLGKIASAGLTAGETQVIADLEPFTLVLDTLCLNTLVFKPPEKIQTIVNMRSRRAMREYFGLPEDPKDADPVDESRIAALRKLDACGTAMPGAENCPRN
jgi:NTE family protein